MTLVDWVLVVVWTGIALSGFWKGAVRLVFAVGGVVIGLWLAATAGAELSAILAPHVGPGWIAAILGRLAPLVVSLVIAGLAGWGLEHTLQALHLGWLNRLAGLGLAGLLGGVLLAVLVTAASTLSPEWREVARHSLIVPRLAGWTVRLQEATADAADDPAPPTADPTPATDDSTSGR